MLLYEVHALAINISALVLRQESLIRRVQFLCVIEQEIAERCPAQNEHEILSWAL
jgi:hypothetical protein